MNAAELPRSPSARASALPARPAMQQQQEKKQEAQGGDSFRQLPLARPKTLSVLAPKASATPAPLTHAEMAEALEPLIQQEVAKVRAALEARGLDPAKVAMIYNLDVTGHAIQVCLACGQVGHNYMPTMVRQENPEINMLSESLVVFQEVASRLGMPYGLVAYDEDVLPLRAVAPPDLGENKEQILRRFETFRDRRDIKKVKDGTIMDWMAAEMAKWNPADATKQVVGDPNDRRAIETGQAMLLKAGATGARGMVLAKGQPAKTSIKALEALASAKGVKLSGIAVGKQAEAVARTMPGKTSIAQNMHDLKGHLGTGMVSLIELGDG